MGWILPVHEHHDHDAGDQPQEEQCDPGLVCREEIAASSTEPPTVGARENKIPTTKRARAAATTIENVPRMFGVHLHCESSPPGKAPRARIILISLFLVYKPIPGKRGD
jgi:hypothetical protein